MKRLLKMRVDAGVTLNRAIVELLADAQDGCLPEPVTALLRKARDARGRRSCDGWVSKATLKRLYRADVLLPRPSALPDLRVQPWHRLAIGLYGRPQKPTKMWVCEQIAQLWKPSLGDKPPSQDQVNYFFAHRYSKGDQHLGRHTGSALRSKQFYQHRTSDGTPPWTQVDADGWTTHFTAPHPVSGEFVTYELWHFQDKTTRYLTPMAIGLSESTEVIAKGLEECIRVGGVPAILQTDSTGSMKNQIMELDPVVSLSARSGMVVCHPVTVGNSQANGLAENLNAWLDRECKALATYQGKDMDSGVLKRRVKLTRKLVDASHSGDKDLVAHVRAELERVTKGIVFTTYAEAVVWIRQIEAKWNNRPHSGLPKIKDSSISRGWRHMTPQESLDAARAAGWKPEGGLDEAALIDLFRVHERRKVTRETVTAYNKQRYYHRELKDYDGETVMVAIDRMEWQHVWVKDLQGRLLCKAEYVHATGHHALSMYEYALGRRAEAQLKRLDDKAQAVERRMVPGLVFEAPATTLDLSALAVPRRTEAPAELLPPPLALRQPPEPEQLGVIETHLRIEQVRQERLAREAEAKKAREAEQTTTAPPQSAVAG